MDLQEAIKVVDAAVYKKEKRHLKDSELTILTGCWHGQTYDEIAENARYEANYLKGDIGPKFWRLLSEALGEHMSKRDFKVALERSRSRFSVAEPQFSAQQEDLASDFYVERSPIESLCKDEILMPGALLRIKAPPKMGKTLVMSRLINHASAQGYRAVNLNLRLAEKTDFENLDTFLRWFCTSITQMLDLPIDVNEHWNRQLGNSKLKCMDYFEDHLLSDSENKPKSSDPSPDPENKPWPPLVLGLDEVDRVFHYEFAGEFLGLLRAWHEKAKTSAIWGKLRLILVHTEDYTHLDINHSPFNAGIPIELPEFSPEQVKDLVEQYKLNWDTDQVTKLGGMVGGHPYLVQVALDHARLGMEFEQLLKTAPMEGGIYSEHLREKLRNLLKLKEPPKLAAALKQIVEQNGPVKLNPEQPEQVWKLVEMGLVKQQDDGVIAYCDLYRQYFKERLKHIIEDKS